MRPPLSIIQIRSSYIRITYAKWRHSYMAVNGVCFFMVNFKFCFTCYRGYAFVFMFKEASFYGKGSTGVLLIIAFGLYKVHIKYFKYVAELKRRITNKEVVWARVGRSRVGKQVAHHWIYSLGSQKSEQPTCFSKAKSIMRRTRWPR